jgi:hypothetical protein
MNDFFSQLEERLEHAAEQRSRPWPLRLRWTRRSALVLIPAIVVASVPAFAAVHGVLHHSTKVTGGPYGVGASYDVDATRCSKMKAPDQTPSTQPPPADVLAVIGTLRRPATQSDALPNAAAAIPFASGINPGAVRLARSDPDGTKAYLIPAQDTTIGLEPGRGQLCKYLVHKVKPQPGVCLYVTTGAARPGGSDCRGAAQIRSGDTTTASWQQGMPRTSAVVSGIAPDGVTSVTLVYRGPDGVHRFTLPVVGNVYRQTLSPIKIGVEPQVIFNGPQGSRVAHTPRPTSRHMILLRRARERRDRDATRVPAVYPRAGDPGTMFELRFRPRVPRSLRAVYVIVLRGPNTVDCGRALKRTYSAQVPLRGKHEGLVSSVYTGADFGGKRWCKATYRGTITLYEHGYNKTSPKRLYGRFALTVR